MLRVKSIFVFLILILFCVVNGVGCQSHGPRAVDSQIDIEAQMRARSQSSANAVVELPVEETLARLLSEVDRDHDKKITVHDGRDLKFHLLVEPRAQGQHIHQGQQLQQAPRDAQAPRDTHALSVVGHYPLSVLLQDLTLAKDHHRSSLSIALRTLHEDPRARIGRFIRDLFWDGLTRRLDDDGVSAMIDSKTKAKVIYLYTPWDDPEAYEYYKRVARRLRRKPVPVAVEVRRLPKDITPGFVRRLDGRHGILTLALERDSQGRPIGGQPFVVPGGRFNEMYGWDSYFIILGLLVDGKIDLARSMVNHLVYQIRHYGKILNANRTYYLTRSQPPFTTSAIRAVHERLPKTAESKAWLLKSLQAAYKEYHDVWLAQPRFVPQYGLSRYFGQGIGPCPEVEGGHYNSVLKPYVGRAPFAGTRTPEELYGKIMNAYRTNPEFRYPDSRLEAFFVQDRAVRESGHDTTYRFSDRAVDFVSVDLNSLLYKTESDFISLMEQKLIPNDGVFGRLSDWKERARRRREKMLALMYDEKTGLFYDYDISMKRRSDYISATTFYPLWAGLVNESQARALVKTALQHLLQPGGLSATALSSQRKSGSQAGGRQWEYPNGWAPHQILAWQGLRNYGMDAQADDLKKRWVAMIIDNFRDYNGTVPEKFNVVTRSHAVFEEYGNVGTDFSYITREGFGWMNASFKIATEAVDAAAVGDETTGTDGASE